MSYLSVASIFLPNGEKIEAFGHLFFKFPILLNLLTSHNVRFSPEKGAQLRTSRTPRTYPHPL